MHLRRQSVRTFAGASLKTSYYSPVCLDVNASSQTSKIACFAGAPRFLPAVRQTAAIASAIEGAMSLSADRIAVTNSVIRGSTRSCRQGRSERVATSHASETHLVLHELAETSHGPIPDRETCWIRSGFDKCPRELRMERSNKLRHLLEKHREGGQTEPSYQLPADIIQVCSTHIAPLICAAIA
jgi:hypothetical protein